MESDHDDEGHEQANKAAVQLLNVFIDQQIKNKSLTEDQLRAPTKSYDVRGFTEDLDKKDKLVEEDQANLDEVKLDEVELERVKKRSSIQRLSSSFTRFKKKK
mgnify:FL=1|jgi:hypothetical protein